MEHELHKQGLFEEYKKTYLTILLKLFKQPFRLYIRVYTVAWLVQRLLQTDYKEYSDHNTS